MRGGAYCTITVSQTFLWTKWTAKVHTVGYRLNRQTLPSGEIHKWLPNVLNNFLQITFKLLPRQFITSNCITLQNVVVGPCAFTPQTNHKTVHLEVDQTLLFKQFICTFTPWFHRACLCFLVCARLFLFCPPCDFISHWEHFRSRASWLPDVVELLRLFIS